MATETNRDPETYSIIGAAMEVHRELGCGFLESVYHDAMALEFALREIPFYREHPITITYKGTKIGGQYRADFVCFDNIIIELKAVSALGESDTAQTLHYLKATTSPKALLINFGSSSLQYKRLIRTQN